MPLKRVPSESLIDLRPTKKNRSDASSYPIGSQHRFYPGLRSFCINKTTPCMYHSPLIQSTSSFLFLSTENRFFSFFSTPPASPRRHHGARLRSITPLPTHMDEAFADLETSMRSRRACTPTPDNFRFSSESARYNMESKPRSVIDFSLPTNAASIDSAESDINLFCPPPPQACLRRIFWPSPAVIAYT